MPKLGKGSQVGKKGKDYKVQVPNRTALKQPFGKVGPRKR